MSHDDNSLLDNDLVWDQGGHLSDIALNAIVDAESAILPRSACEHAEVCEQCALRVGQLAQLSLEIDSALLTTGLAHAPSTSHIALKAKRGWPLMELALALVLALVGQLPTLQALNPAGIPRVVKGVVHLSVQVFQHLAGTAFGTALPWVSATLLLAASSGVAFAARRGFHRKLQPL